MIQVEKFYRDGKTITKTFSDKGLYIIDQQSQIKYEVVFNPIYKTRFYLETDELIIKDKNN